MGANFLMMWKIGREQRPWVYEVPGDHRCEDPPCARHSQALGTHTQVDGRTSLSWEHPQFNQFIQLTSRDNWILSSGLEDSELK